MPLINFSGKPYQINDNENLLDGLLRQGIRIPFSCRAGVCHSCLLRADRGTPPKNSQFNLNAQQVREGYFLACQSLVTDNLDVSVPARDAIPVMISALERVSLTTTLITLSTRFSFNGQENEQVHLISPGGYESLEKIRKISSDKNIIELTVERKAGDAFSRWAIEEAVTGDSLLLNKKRK